MEELSKDSEQKYKFLLNNLSDAMIETDSAGTITYLNSRIYDMLGYTIEEEIGNIIFDYLHPDDLTDTIKIFNEAVRTKSLINLDCRVRHKNGHHIPILARGRMVEINETVRAMILIRDNTERVKFEQELHFLSSITQQTKDSIIVTDTNFKIIYVNKATEDLYGYTQEELLGKTPNILNAEPLASSIQEDIYQTIRANKIWVGVFLNRRKDGNTFISEHKISPLMNIDGQVTSYISITRDITSSKNSEQELKVSEEKYRHLFEDSLVMIALINIKGKIIDINKRLADYIGYKKEKLIGMNLRDLTSIFPNFRIKRVNKLIKKLITKGFSQPFEAHIKKRTGQMVWLKGQVFFIDIGSEKLIQVLMEDITKQKESEQKLIESEKRYRDLFNNSSDMMFLVNMEGRMVDVNKEFLDYSGFNRQKFIGSHFKILTELTSQETLPLFIEKFKEIVSKGRLNPVEFLFVDNKGVNTWINFKARVIEREKEKFIEVIVRDITKRMEAQQKLKSALDRETFYKNLFTHDINNILNNIRTSISLFTLYQNDPNAEQELDDIIKVLKDQAKRGTHLVSNVVELSNLEEKSISLQAIDARAVLDDSVKIVKDDFQIKTIDIQILSNKTKFLVLANELLLNVFENILNNAVKYCDNPIVEIDIQISEKLEAGVNYAKFEFIDNGIGIHDSMKELIFQEGYMKNKGVKGLGFGLSLVKKIIESYNGQIWIEDKINGDHKKGSNFVILIPQR